MQMELALLLYVASIADNVRHGAGLLTTFLAILTLIGIAAVIFSGMAIADWKDHTDLKEEGVQATFRINRLGRKLAVISFLCWAALYFVSHLVPERKDVYVMAGGYVALKVAHSPVVQDTANSALSSIEKWLDTELAKELAKTKQAADAKQNSKKKGRE
jgi:hypothetical protein